MDGHMLIDLDRLPIKRLESIEESGSERFPPEIGPDQKRLDLIRRIDFSSVVERGAKKAKSSKDAAATAKAAPWPWQSLVENLQLAQQELSVILDLINTVEANDAVTVAGMTRPKPLPNEVLSDLSVSAATKLQHFRHLGKYFEQSSKALEKQVVKETRFYDALIRLQQNWKVKRLRGVTSVPNNEGFTIDLLDSSLSDSAVFSRSSLLTTVRVDHDSSGMLAVQLPPKSYRFLHFGFLGNDPSDIPADFTKKIRNSRKSLPQEDDKESVSEEDVDECVKMSHSVLRDIHQAIIEEQVFDLVNRDTFHPSPGVNVLGMQEDFLHLGVGQDASVFLYLVPAEVDNTREISDSTIPSKNGETPFSNANSLELAVVKEKHNTSREKILGFPNSACFQIYLKHILHENVLSKTKEGRHATKPQMVVQSSGDGPGLLSHFCMSIAHRIFSRKVLAELENLASGVPYLHLLTQPTWHSRISSWSLSMKIPQSILHAGQPLKPLDTHERKHRVRMQFHTKVVVTDECISVSGEGAPNVIVSFGGNSMDARPPNCYGCDLVDLPVILLQQIASQVIRWLHEEALVVGMKANRDFLYLFFDLEEGNKIGLAAHVDPDDIFGCISWWLVIDDGSTEDRRPHNAKLSNVESENRRFLGYLSLDALYSTLMDLVGLCGSGGSF